MTRFLIRRTSNGYSPTDDPPCEGCERGTYPYWDVRTFKSFEEHDAKLTRERFVDRGTEHQVVRGPRGGAVGIKRRLRDEDGWFREFTDLNDLLAFADEHGELVIGSALGNPSVREIEIYDDYRE
jgi:hypothetical protein